MQTVRIIQAVILMTLLALAASCAVTRQYTAKVFRPSAPAKQDSTAKEIRFLAMDEKEEEDSSLVSTDIITGRDTATTTATAIVPAATARPMKDSVILKTDTIQTSEPAVMATRENPVTKPETRGTRQKRTRGQ